MPKRRTPQPLSLRLDPKLVARVDRLILKHHNAEHAKRPGPPMMSRADMLRWVVAVGVETLEAKMEEEMEEDRS